jgi:hypothetical protein
MTSHSRRTHPFITSWLSWTFIIAAICGVTGVLVTWIFVPDMTGKDLADEDVSFMEYLKAEGWEGEVGEHDQKGLEADINTLPK